MWQEWCILVWRGFIPAPACALTLLCLITSLVNITLLSSLKLSAFPQCSPELGCHEKTFPRGKMQLESHRWQLQHLLLSVWHFKTNFKRNPNQRKTLCLEGKNFSSAQWVNYFMHQGTLSCFHGFSSGTALDFWWPLIKTSLHKGQHHYSIHGSAQHQSADLSGWSKGLNVLSLHIQKCFWLMQMFQSVWGLTDFPPDCWGSHSQVSCQSNQKSALSSAARAFPLHGQKLFNIVGFFQNLLQML